MNTDYGGGYWIFLAIVGIGIVFMMVGVLIIELTKGVINYSKKNLRSILLFSFTPLFAISILAPFVCSLLILEPYNLGTIARVAINFLICFPTSIGLIFLTMKLFNKMDLWLSHNSSTTNN